jgi:hypothetical protein
MLKTSSEVDWWNNDCIGSLLFVHTAHRCAIEPHDNISGLLCIYAPPKKWFGVCNDVLQFMCGQPIDKQNDPQL